MIALVLLLFFTSLGLQFSYKNAELIKSAGDQSFEIPEGAGLLKVLSSLNKKGYLDKIKFSKLLVKFFKPKTQVFPGTYTWDKSMSLAAFFSMLSNPNLQLHKFTIQEGWNLYEIADKYEKEGFGTKEAFIKASYNKNLLEKFKIPFDSFEGFLFPETYMLEKPYKAEAMVEAMVKLFFSKSEKLRQTPEFKEMGLKKWSVLASMIEKETGAGFERPIISSVFHNRLRKGMRLQSDPTIIYAYWVKTGERLTNIRKRHLTTPTDYNTYTVKALPKGPIGNPGYDALHAVLYPKTTDLLYFVSQNDGTHYFSKTYKEHLNAVQRYQLNSSARKGKSWRDLNK